jgi:hypothetical protein
MMMRHALLIGMVLGVLAASGCCGLHHGCGITVCEPMGCCDVGCGPVCGDGCCGMDCGCCEEVCCEPCCDPCGGSCCHRRGPLSWALGLLRCCFHCGWWGGCGACGGGCGEFYWSDFHSVPPNCCDPCDRCGNWTGGGYGGGCDTCWEGHCQTSGYEGGYVARNQTHGTRRTARATGGPKASQGYVSGDSSSRYAPRIVSVTDRAVGPAESESPSAEQAGRPHLAPVRK